MYSLVEIPTLFTKKNFANMSSSQLEIMKEEFNNATLSLKDRLKLSPPSQFDSPIPTLTVKLVKMNPLYPNCSFGKKYEFDSDAITLYSKLKTVKMCGGRFLRMIQFSVIDSDGDEKNLKPHGKASGRCNELTLDEGEYINTAHVYFWITKKGGIRKCVVSGIKISTNKNQFLFNGDTKDTEETVCIK